MNIEMWIFLLLLFIPSQLFSRTTDAGPCCSDLKVKITFEFSEDALEIMQSDYGPKTEQRWENELPFSPPPQLPPLNEEGGGRVST